MPAKPPKRPKDATKEELDEYSQKLEQYFQEREKELADQQRQADIASAEVDKEKANLELKEREAEEEKVKNEKLKTQLTEDMEALQLSKESHEEVWREESAKLAARRLAMMTEKKKLEKMAEELEHLKPGDGTDKGEAAMAEFFKQQHQLLTKITTLEEKRELRETDEAKRMALKDSIGRGVKPPVFRGDKGERPEAHILRAEDWMEASNPGMTDAMKVRNFKLTLDHHAREWYDKADSKGNYEKMKVEFSRHFSTQGKSIRNLHTRWNTFSFDPNTDDIEVFLRNVQETAKQLQYNEATVVNMIKSKMPLAMYSTLYDIHDLERVVTRCRDIYAKSSENTAESSTPTGGAAAAANPFTQIKDEFFYIADGGVNGHQKQKPFKPHVTPQGRGKKKNRGGGRGGRGKGQQRSFPQRQNNLNRGQANRGGWQPRGRGGRGGFDRSPNQRKPRVASKTPNQDRCFNCNEPGHFSRECPQRNNGNANPRPQQQKAFPGFNVVQPQMYAQMPIPQMAQVPMQMTVPTAQVQMQNNTMTDQTAAMGHMREVMMHMQDVTADDNPCYMHISEIPREGEASLNY